MKSLLAGESAAFETAPRDFPAQQVSSRGLDWSGFTLEKHSAEPGERPERLSERHILGLWSGDIAYGERPNGRGGFEPYAVNPGTVTFLPAGWIPAIRVTNSFEITLCLLESDFMQGVMSELDRQPTQELRYLPAIDDPSIRQLMTLLSVEARQGGPSGKLYADYLAHAIAIRMFSYKGRQIDSRRSPSALPRHLLRRVVQRMHDLNSPLDLQILARETGYSRTHFLRMFRAATGATPHQYLLRLRVQRAQELMRRGKASLIDVAAACGFSNHAHMSRIFRQLLGVTPSDYRRTL